MNFRALSILACLALMLQLSASVVETYTATASYSTSSVPPVGTTQGFTIFLLDTGAHFSGPVNGPNSNLTVSIGGNHFNDSGSIGGIACGINAGHLDNNFCVIATPVDVPSNQISFRNNDPTTPQVSGTLTYNGGGGSAFTVTLTMKGTVFANSIKLNTTGRSMSVGWYHNFSAEVWGSRAPLQTQPTVAWSTSNPTVGSITPSGYFLAKSPGTTVVTAQCDSVSASVTMTVVGDGAPTAYSQGVACVEDGARTIVLQAIDLENNPLTYSIVQGPTFGTLSGTPPNLGYVRLSTAGIQGDFFTFRATDSTGKVSNIANVVIKIVGNPALIPATTGELLAHREGVNGQSVDGLPEFSVTGLSADPIHYGTGAIAMYVDDLVSDGFSEWGVRRSYSNLQDAQDSPFGFGWHANFQPVITKAGANYIVRMGADEALVFTQSGTSYLPLRFNVETLSLVNGDYRFKDAQGNSTNFYSFDAAVPVALQGRFKSFADPQGNVTAATYDAGGMLQKVDRSVTVNGVLNTEAFVYSFNFDGRVSKVVRQVTTGGATTIVRQAEYDYYAGNASDFGEAGTLRRVTIKDGAATPNILNRYYYRYYKTGEAGGYLNGLKFVVGPHAYARLVHAYADAESVTDAQLLAYADKYFTYDSNQRVTSQRLHGDGIDATGTYNFSYFASTNADGYNNWQIRTTETLPDGNQNIVYTNYAGQVLVKVAKDVTAGKQWIDVYRYDNVGREELHATPSATTGYSESYPDLINFASGNSPYLSDNAGLILRKVYYTSTTATTTAVGGVAGYLQMEQSQQGELGPRETLRQLEYIGH